MDDLSGQEIRGYKLVEHIGAGGFGVVYRAEQPAFDRQVTIKVILPEFASHPEFVRRFEVEARLVARLEHPHIVPFYDYWRDEQGAYLVMRWLPGGSLRLALENGPLDVDAAGRLLGQIAEALDTAHKHEVVHRDLKPENILFDGSGNAYLTDFGIAKDLGGERLTSTGDIVGSVDYLAPEQAKGEPVTPKTDIYALGIVLYEMLVGEHPFPKLTTIQMLQKHLNEALPSLRAARPNLPAGLDDVIQVATDKDPDERYSHVLELLEAYRRVIAMEEAPPTRRVKFPGFLKEDAEGREVERPVFVARKRQLTRLSEFLENALAGHGQVVFVTGGAGRGKTALLGEFARRALGKHADLLVARGNCSAYSGLGDPYLPFRDVMGMLTGEVESCWAAGEINTQQARALWELFPHTVQVLLEHGSDLLGLFVSPQALLSRVSTAPGDISWRRKLKREIKEKSPQREGVLQSHLFDQYTNVLKALSEDHPLIIMLDDLQWIDTASISLLFHLGRRLEGSRTLVLGAYRPEEVSTDRDGLRHPLEKALSEFKRSFGDIWIDLDQTNQREGRTFVEAFVDTEPNVLGGIFRHALFQHTEGHPLFTIELLRAMQERGDIHKDVDGRWVQADELDWATLPPRVDAVIEERIHRLDDELKEILSIASVEGEVFTAQVVNRVAEIGERFSLRRLSEELERQHRLIKESGEERVGENSLSRYKFSHTLFQQYIYNHLPHAERRLLHAQIGGVLEEYYVGRLERVATLLARHFQEAAVPEKAVDYQIISGDQARRFYAHSEAEFFYRQAVESLRAKGDKERAARTLMKLGLAYTSAFEVKKAQKTYEQAFSLWEPLRKSSVTLEGGEPGAVLRIALEQPSNLDPGAVDDDASTFLSAQLFEGLVRMGSDYNVLPAAARHWEVDDRGSRYVFHLRGESHWSDGSLVTASDFEFAWKRNLNPERRFSSARRLYPILNARSYQEGDVDDPELVGVKALDDNTLEVRLESPTAYFPYLLARPVAYPLPRDLVEHSGSKWIEPETMVTNGPYTIKEFQPGERITLLRNQGYKGVFPGNVERIECTLYKDLQHALEMYHDDLADLVTMFYADPASVADVLDKHGDDLAFFPRPSTLYLTFRVDKPPFNDLRVRRAFVLAVDREALSKQISPSLRAADGGFVPPGMVGHSPGIGLCCDPEEARRNLAEAGYPGGVGFPQVEWLHGVGSKDEPLVPFLKNTWRTLLGLEIESKTLEWEKFFQRIREDPAHMTIVGWSADYPDPDNMLRVQFHSQQGFNPPRWHNDQFDELVEKAARVTDHEERMALYQEADRILVADQVVIMPLGYGVGRMLAKAWVSLPEGATVNLMPIKNIRVERRNV
ncbi:MAG: ABC transporter substrate-binding protein [Anaerolineales bacterium]|jgi:oligopeptide transport system substrate-binding protein